MKVYLNKVVDLLKTTCNEWSEDKAARLAAALAYYTIFSIPPLLIIVLAIVGQFFNHNMARDQLMAQIGGLIGQQGADFIRSLLENASKPADTIVASALSVITLLLGATGVFGALQGSLNTIWEVAPRPGRGLLGTLKDRFLSFTMVLGIGFLLMVSLVVSTALAAISNFFAGNPAQASGVLELLNTAVSFMIITMLFAMMFKIIPDVEIAWRDVWLGAAVTAFLFTLGKFAIGLYLGHSSVASTYGAAGSLVIILIWIYYSAQILFMGAEFTQVYANRYGSRVRPNADAIPLTDEARTQQGLPRQGLPRQAGSQGPQPATASSAANRTTPGAAIETTASQANNPGAKLRTTAEGGASSVASSATRPLQTKPHKNVLYYVGMLLAVVASLWFSVRETIGR